MRPLVILALCLSACTPSEPQFTDSFVGEPATPADAGAYDGDVFRSHVLLNNLSPLFYGETTTFEVTGAVAGETVYFVYTLAGVGPGLCPAPLGGLCLDIQNPVTVFGTPVADATGRATVDLALPASGPPGTSAHFQAAIPRGVGGVDSVTSNAVSLVADYNNSAPTAGDDNYVIDEDAVLSPVGGLFANDSDPDGDPLTPIPIVPPANGLLVVNPDGTFTYTPSANWFGVDTFTYQADDGIARSNIATVTVTVNSVNDAPGGAGETYNAGVIEDTIYMSAPGSEVLANDGDVEGQAIEAVLATQPTDGGNVALNLDGSFTYTPAQDFAGDATWTYQARDTLGAMSDPITVTMRVAARNDSPVVVPENYATGRDVSLVVGAPGLLANDTDVDGPLPLTAEEVAIARPANGTLTLNTNGSFTYQPDLCYIGPDQFDYRAVDGQGSRSDPGTVTLDVGAGAPLDLAFCDAFDPVVLDFAFDIYTFQGFETRAYVPANPVGLVYFFHASGASVTGLRSNDNDTLWNELVSRGYGIVATSATNSGDWDGTTTNANQNDDWGRLSAIRDDLILTTDLTAGTSVVAVGASDGGYYAGTFARIAQNQGWPLSVITAHMAGPTDAPNVATFFFGSQNDNVVPASLVFSAYQGHNGVKSYVEHAEETLHPMHFMRNEEFSHALSQAHFDELVNLGAIDAAGNRLLADGAINGFLNAYPSNTSLIRPTQVTSSLSVIWAQHRYSSQFHIQEADFIDANR